MSYNTLVNTIPITPKSLKEVKSTGLKDLKALCKDAGINIGGVGREGLEVLSVSVVIRRRVPAGL